MGVTKIPEVGVAKIQQVGVTKIPEVGREGSVHVMADCHLFCFCCCCCFCVLFFQYR